MTSIPILLPDSDPVYLEGSFPLTEADWEQMMTVLQAMKLGIVKRKGVDDPSEDE